MNFLLDTNVVSEWTKPRPDPQVVAWLAAVDEDRLLLSVITLAELRNGVASLPPSRRREQLDTWLSYELRDRFAGRLLPIDAAIADQWGSITAAAKAMGRTIHAMDALLAASAFVHELTLVTRDQSDFEGVGIALFCPWSSN